MNRRHFLATAGAAVAAAVAVPSALRAREGQTPAAPKPRFRTGLVAYSFSRTFQAKTTTYEDLIRTAVDTGADGVDLTVYWLPSTADDYLLPLRRFAYRNRVEIYSIGTRVQLAQRTPEARETQLAALRNWVDIAQKLGASHVRVFGGRAPAGASMEQAIGMAVETLKRGAEYAGARGISLGVENDAGITDHAKETLAIVKGADSPWVGTNLDLSNFKPPDVYGQIEMSIPYAVSTHIKTTVTLDDGKAAPFDWDRIFTMFAAHGYRGYMGLEYEDPEDSATAVPRYIRRLKELAVKYSA